MSCQPGISGPCRSPEVTTRASKARCFNAPRSAPEPRQGSLAGLRAPALPLRFATMRDRETIDSELRLIAALRRTAADMGAPVPRIDVADEVLDEWIIACPAGPSEAVPGARCPSNNLDV